VFIWNYSEDKKGNRAKALTKHRGVVSINALLNEKHDAIEHKSDKPNREDGNHDSR